MLPVRCLDRRYQGHEALWQIALKLFAMLKSAMENNCTRNLTGGHRNFCWTDDVWYRRCAKPCWGWEHLRDDRRNTCQAN